MTPLTITALEEATGVPRSTIYYYVREGLLPTAQKAAASRALYTEAHAELLADIDRLKKEGLSLAAIKTRLAPKVAAAGASEVDLVARQAEQTRQAILETAARLFARRGYKRTRVVDIIREVGITPPLFYSHFNSKQQLLVEAFGVFIGWMRVFVEPRLLSEPDAGERHLARTQAYLGVQALSPDLLSLIRAEAMHEDGEVRAAVQKTLTDMIEGTRREFVDLRGEGHAPVQVSDELMSHGLLGGLENMLRRASWDETYSSRDVLWAAQCMFLAVQAVYTGQLDLTGRLAEYEKSIDRLTDSAPPVPPAALS